MKGIKRFLSIFLVLAMIMTSNASFVFADSVNDNDATTALQTTTTENLLENADDNIEEEASVNTDTKNAENDNKDIKTTNAENDENNINDNQNDDIENIVATEINEEDNDNLSPDDFSNEDNDSFEYEEEPEEDSTTAVTDTTRQTTVDENESTVDSEETSSEEKQATTETTAETTTESEEQTTTETTTHKEEQTTAETTIESEEQTTAETTTKTTTESEEQTTTETTTKNEDVAIATDSEMEGIVSEELPNNLFGAGTKSFQVFYDINLTSIPSSDYNDYGIRGAQSHFREYNAYSGAEGSSSPRWPIEVNDGEPLGLKVLGYSSHDTWEPKQSDVDISNATQGDDSFKMPSWIMSKFNTQPDGNGTDYSIGQDLAESDFTLDTSDNIYKLTLYAQWAYPRLTWANSYGKLTPRSYKKLYNVGESINLSGLMANASYEGYFGNGAIGIGDLIAPMATLDPPLDTLTSLQESDTNIHVSFKNVKNEDNTDAYMDIPIIVGRDFKISYDKNYPAGNWGVAQTRLSEDYDWDVDLSTQNLTIKDDAYNFNENTILKGKNTYMILDPTTNTLKKLKEWRTKADGTGTRYTFGQSITVLNEDFKNKELKLYAVWETVPIQKFAICYMNGATKDWTEIYSYDSSTYFNTILNSIGTTHIGYYEMTGVTTIDDTMLTSYNQKTPPTALSNTLQSTYNAWIANERRANVVYGLSYPAQHFYLAYTHDGGTKEVEVEETDYTNIDDVVSKITSDKFRGWFEITPTNYSKDNVKSTYNPSINTGLITTDELKTAFNTWNADQSYNKAYGASTTKYVGIQLKNGITIDTSYIEGQNLDPTGLIIEKKYDDGTVEEIDYATHSVDFTLSPSITDVLTTNNNKVTITYEGKQVTYDIIVAAKQVTAITLSPAPTDTTYYSGETLDVTGLAVLVSFDNGTTETVSYVGNENKFSFNPLLTTPLATTHSGNVTVTYGGKSATYNITVTDPDPTITRILESISVKTTPNKMTYNQGEALDPAGLVITANYSMAPLTEDISYTGNEARFIFTPTLGDGLTMGYIAFMYNGKQTSFDVTINTPSSNPSGSSGSSSGSHEDVKPPVGAYQNDYIYHVPVTHTNNYSGFYNVVDRTYYRDNSGNNIIGWLGGPDAKWYLFEHREVSDKGKMITGFRKETYGTYYFYEDGKMATGLTNVSNNTYYFEDTKDIREGIMTIGWKNINGNWYYFDINGIMLKNTTTPDNYSVDANGKWVEN